MSPADLANFRKWFARFDADAWDRQFEADASAGKFDALAAAALREHDEGKSAPL